MTGNNEKQAAEKHSEHQAEQELRQALRKEAVHNVYARFHLTRIRRENPAFNYGFFRPNPLAFERGGGKNAGHGSDFTGPGNPEQAEIARSGSGRDSAQTF